MCGRSRARRRLHRVDADPGAASLAGDAGPALRAAGARAARRQPGDRRRIRQERRADRRAVCPGRGDGDRTAGEAPLLPRRGLRRHRGPSPEPHRSRARYHRRGTHRGSPGARCGRLGRLSEPHAQSASRDRRPVPRHLRRAPRRHRGLCRVHQHAGQRGVSRLWRTAVDLRHGARPRPVRPRGRDRPRRDPMAQPQGSGRVVRPEGAAGRPARHRAVSRGGRRRHRVEPRTSPRPR